MKALLVLCLVAAACAANFVETPMLTPVEDSRASKMSVVEADDRVVSRKAMQEDFDIAPLKPEWERQRYGPVTKGCPKDFEVYQHSAVRNIFFIS